MALNFNSHSYDGTGQTSTSFLSQRHKLLLFDPKISFTLIIPSKFKQVYNKFQKPCQEFFEIFEQKFLSSRNKFSSSDP